MFLHVIMFILQKLYNYTYKMGVIKQINIKSQIYYFYKDIIDLENFKSNLLNIDKSYNHIKTLVFTTLDILQLKKLMIIKIFTRKSFIFSYCSCKWIY